MRHTATAWSVSWVNPKPRVVSVSVCVYASLPEGHSLLLHEIGLEAYMDFKSNLSRPKYYVL